MRYKGITLDPFQVEAVGTIEKGHSLVVAAPTGAGKTVIAEYALEKCLDEGGRAIYTAPIKALSNQKFRDFTARYGDRIGIKTGDVTINADAEIVLMTTEIFRNTIFESPRHLDHVSYTIFDEIHFLDDIERGTVWEESIIFAPPHIRFLCLSATIPNIAQLARWVRHVRPDTPLDVIVENERPVPLRHKIYVPTLGVRNLDELRKLERGGRMSTHYAKQEDPVWRQKLIDHLHEGKRLPAIFFAFNRRQCEELAATVQGSLLDADERRRILELFDELCRRFGMEPDPAVLHLRTILGQGAAYHHAGLLPTLKEVVERLFTSGLVKLLFATETFAVGVNMPARTVVFNTLYKFDGQRLGYLPTRAHHQMSGRAGRRGIDKVGYVYSVAEWPHTRARRVEQILWGDIEPIRSQFNLSYGAILSLYEHLGEKIYHATEKSFANFLARKRKRKDATRDMRDQIRRKILLLRTMGYIHGQKVTKKGLFAKTIYGYELQVAELFFNRLLHHLSEDEINVLFCGIVYEAKKDNWYRKLNHGRFRFLRKKAYQAVDDILYHEDSLGVEDRTKRLEFHLGSAVHAWSRGCDFREIEAHTSTADGDIVRFFRLTIQVLRNTLHACAKDDPLRDTLRAAVARMCRGVIDAERQLRLGTEMPPGEEEEEKKSREDPESQ
ncbi:MAG: DEAD/DEAH box helicase [Planctomycetota bacterium]|jgi:superfamily II RNA helicase